VGVPSDANVLLDCDEIIGALSGMLVPLRTEATLSHTDDDVLDTYLYLSAFEQVLADHLHRGLYNLGNAVSYLQHSRQLVEILTLRLPSRLSRLLDVLLRTRLLSVVGGAIDQVALLRVNARLALREPGLARLWEALWDLQVALGERLARSAAGDARGEDGAWLAGRLGQLLSDGARSASPQWLGARLRLPSCFNVFDVYPEDCFRLGARVAEGLGDLGTPVLCLGIRTSGSYLGPFIAGEVRRLGLADVGYATTRPRCPLLGPERRRITAACRSGHRVVIVDDPPQTGRALAMTARRLFRLGARPEAITCAYVANSPGHGPRGSATGAEWRNIWAEQIAGVRLAFLEPHERHISRLLSVQQISTSIGPAGCLPRQEEPQAAVLACAAGENTAPLSAVPSRGHQQRRFHLPGSGRSGRGAVHAIAAKGVGLGFFGRRVGVVAERLREWVPDTVACRHGVLIADEGSGSAEGPDAHPTVAEVAGYVAARTTALRLQVDPSLPLDDRACGWRKIAAELCRGYHMLGPFHAEKVTRRIRQVFAPQSPAVIDSAMGTGSWLRTADGKLRKRDFEEGPFGSNDVLLFDPAYDLASATYELGLSPAQWRELLGEYERAASQRVGPARLYLHQLLCGSQALNSTRIMLAGMRGAAGRRLTEAEFRGLDATTRRAEDFLTRATHAFLAQVYGLRQTEPDGSRVFALDIDGVLADGRPGFPSTTPAGAQALRCLARHGWGVVVVTGRSLEQAAAWCEDLGLHGAVAEYGAAIWDARRRESADLRSTEDAAAVAHACEALAAFPGVYVDPTYQHGIRAYRWARGCRESLGPEALEMACPAAGRSRLRPVAGLKQTDLIPGSADKGRGLQALLDMLGWRPRSLWGIGDTLDDLPFLRLAHQAWAPANARADLKRELRRQPGGHVSRASQQLAVLQAAASAACGGRRPCRGCRQPIDDVECRTVADLLASRNQPVWRAVVGALNPDALAMFRCDRQ